jgi:hypothetical protein
MRSADLRWPNLFVVGAAKAGTTSLHHYLSQHPDIYMSPIKEPHFFSKVQPDRKYIALSGCQVMVSEQAYLQLFSRWQHEKIAGEASPSYLWDQATPDRIKQVCPDAKIIIMLRNPVNRSYSHYLNEVRAGLEKRPFLEAIQADLQATDMGWGISSLYIALGLYSAQVQRYLERFNDVLVIFFEEFIANTALALRQIFQFLAVDPGYSAHIQPEILNPYASARGQLGKVLIGTPIIRQISRAVFPSPLRSSLKQLVLVRSQKPAMDRQAQDLLSTLYAQEFITLPALLKRDLPWKVPSLMGG